MKTCAAIIVLGAPRLARSATARPLRFVPIQQLTMLDPTFAGTPHTRSHAYLMFDTLYGLDETFTARPQMVEGHTIESDGTIWRLTLRDRLRFHDGNPVLARDAVASIRRAAARDGFSQALMAATDELAAPDDRTILFRLKRPFPRLPQALAGLITITPIILPARLANANPAKPITEMIGSGPYRFIAADFVMGERSAYERFEGYTPRAEGKAALHVGAKGRSHR